MVKFRWRRGSLADSLATEVEVKNIAALAELVRPVVRTSVVESNISVNPYTYRLGKAVLWVVYLRGYGVLGFTDGAL